MTCIAMLAAAQSIAVAQHQTSEATILDVVVVERRRSSVSDPKDARRLLPAAPGGQVASGNQLGILGNRDVMSTPFNITGYTSRLVADTQARSIADVAANDPSVRLTFPRSSYRDVYSIRGFNLFSYNVGFDGLHGIAPKQRFPAEFAERIEILKGPDTFLNGISLGGSVGGAINIIPKRATDDSITAVTSSYVSDGGFGLHVDKGQRLGANKDFGIRFNGLVRAGDLGVDDQSETVGGVALSLEHDGGQIRLHGDFGILRQGTDAPDWAATVAPSATSIPVPSSTVGLSQPWARLRLQDAYGVLRAEYHFSENWTAFGALGVSITGSSGVYVQPTSLKPNGDFIAQIASLPSDGEHHSGQVGIRGRFDAGPIEHNVTVTMARWTQNLKAVRTSLGAFHSNIFHPIAVPPPDESPIVDLEDLHRTAEHRYTSLAFADTLGMFDGRLLLTLGGRWQTIENINFAAESGAATSFYDKSKFSPAAGAIVKLFDNVSLYANYAEGLQQGGSAPGTATNHDESFSPTAARQVEIGLKIHRGTWMSSFGVFQIAQPSGVTNPITNIYSQQGKQRNRGVEINIAGEPIARVRVLGGVLLLDGRLIHSAGGKYDGNHAIGAPGHQINLALEWDTPLLEGLTLSARTINTGRQFVDAGNTQHIDGWTRFDIGIRRVIRRGGNSISLRLAVENLFDKDYWASASSGQVSGISRGAPRTFLASTTLAF